MFKAPKYQAGQVPSPEDLRRMRAPESLIKAVKDISSGDEAGFRIQRGGRMRLPAPIEEPLVKIMTGLELLKLQKGRERLEKETVRRERQEKEVELTWTIKENDLVWSLNRIKQWLSEGTRVTVSLTRKRRWLAPPEDVCTALIAKIRESVAEVSDVKEQNVSKLSKAEKERKELDDPEAPAAVEPLRGFGSTMTLSFVPKAKPSSLSDAVNLSVPWLLSDTQLKQQLKAIGSALKKGRNVRITLSDSDTGKVKGALDRDDIFKAIRSECRQAKDVRVKRIEGELTKEASTIVLEVMGGVSKGFLREIEICADLQSKDAELRMKWIDDWIKQGLEVTVWADPSGDAAQLAQALGDRLTNPIIKETEEDSFGQKKFVVVKEKIENLPVEMPAWTPAPAPAPTKSAAKKANSATTATNLLHSLSSGTPPVSNINRQTARPAPMNNSRPAANNRFNSPAASKTVGINTNRTSTLGANRHTDRNATASAHAGISDLLKSIAAGDIVRPPQAFGRR
jgi:translation initiation factor IF-3